MGQAIPRQHPAVVLRSHYRHLRALLAVAMIAVVGLTIAVVVLAVDGDEAGNTTSATPIGSIHYGGFNPATGRPESAPLPQREAAPEDRPGTRYDGGPEEGTRAVVATPSSGIRYDGGPEEGTRAVVATPSSDIRYDGGPEEGTAALGTR
jgi:hypothetical protein